jgi:hypothetical protein
MKPSGVFPCAGPSRFDPALPKRVAREEEVEMIASIVSAARVRLTLVVVASFCLSPALFHDRAGAAEPGTHLRRHAGTRSRPAVKPFVWPSPYAYSGIIPGPFDEITPLMPAYWLGGSVLDFTVPPQPPACAMTQSGERYRTPPLPPQDALFFCEPLYQ